MNTPVQKKAKNFNFKMSNVGSQGNYQSVGNLQSNKLNQTIKSPGKIGPGIKSPVMRPTQINQTKIPIKSKEITKQAFNSTTSAKTKPIKRPGSSSGLSNSLKNRLNMSKDLNQTLQTETPEVSKQLDISVASPTVKKFKIS